jgi:hypothetical protein
MVIGLDDDLLRIVELCVAEAEINALPSILYFVSVELSEPCLTTQRVKNLMCVTCEDEFRIVKNHATSAMFSSQ